MLPQLSDQPLLTDSGLETDLAFHHGVDLPCFAAFPLLDDEDGRALLAHYYAEHVEVAQQAGLAIVLETPTWRASADWGTQLGYDADALDRVNRDAVAVVREMSSSATVPVVVSGCVGPRGDGYVIGQALAPDDAADYHRPQIASLAAAGADLVTAMTLTHVGEAAGFVRAARDVGVPCAASFTVETDGRLPDGTPLAAAVDELDALTGSAAAYVMVNCAHPDHLLPALDAPGPWRERVRCVRANASRQSHAELDASEVLDEGDPRELAGELVGLRAALPRLTALGGCCGTDVRHVQALADALVAARGLSAPP